MKRHISALMLVIGLFSGGCSISINQTIPGWDQIILLDVQGLWGGRDLWISSDGSAFCRVVEPPAKGGSGLLETLYSFTISDGQRVALHSLFNTHHFCSIQIEDRYGLPDEARPIIVIRAGGEICRAAKWLNDSHQGFDSIYKHLLMIVENGRLGKKIGSGTYDWRWKPDGFAENQTFYEIVLPASQ